MADKKTLKQRAQDYLERSEASEVHATADEFLFLTKQDAKAHAKGLKDKKITTYKTELPAKPEADEVDLTELNAKDSIEFIKEATSLEEIEPFAKDDRKTVQEAYAEKVEELEAAE
jgi:hypothetical protein